MVRKILFGCSMNATVTLDPQQCKLLLSVFLKSFNFDSSCILQGLPFVIAVVVPVYLALLCNLAILILSFHGISGKRRLSINQKPEASETVIACRRAFACAVLLGVTWLFAFLAIDKLREVFQWLFCIFNSLQGMLS